jgi:hypothetical protein
MRKILAVNGSKLIHGRRSTYTNHGCRCEACAKANRDYQRPYMRGVYKRARGERDGRKAD